MRSSPLTEKVGKYSTHPSGKVCIPAVITYFNIDCGFFKGNYSDNWNSKQTSKETRQQIQCFTEVKRFQLAERITKINESPHNVDAAYFKRKYEIHMDEMKISRHLSRRIETVLYYSTSTDSFVERIYNFDKVAQLHQIWRQANRLKCNVRIRIWSKPYESTTQFENSFSLAILGAELYMDEFTAFKLNISGKRGITDRETLCLL